MGWEEDLFALLDDLEHQAEALYDADRSSELVDRSRAEYAQISFASRLMASLGSDVGLDVHGVGAVRGRLDRVGDGWCLVRGSPPSGARDWIVRTGAIALMEDASPRSVPEVAWPPAAALGLGSPLRRLADAGVPCLVRRTDGTRLEGALRRVGADFVEVEMGSGRRALVRFDALAAVQSG